MVDAMIKYWDRFFDMVTQIPNGMKKGGHGRRTRFMSRHGLLPVAATCYHSQARRLGGFMHFRKMRKRWLLRTATMKTSVRSSMRSCTAPGTPSAVISKHSGTDVAKPSMV